MSDKSTIFLSQMVESKEAFKLIMQVQLVGLLEDFTFYH